MHYRRTCTRIGRGDCRLNSVARHITITLLAFMVVGIFAMFALNLSFLNPIAQVVEDFEMTDIYYQILCLICKKNPNRCCDSDSFHIGTSTIIRFLSGVRL